MVDDAKNLRSMKNYGTLHFASSSKLSDSFTDFYIQSQLFLGGDTRGGDMAKDEILFLSVLGYYKAYKSDPK